MSNPLRVVALASLLGFSLATASNLLPVLPSASFTQSAVQAALGQNNSPAAPSVVAQSPALQLADNAGSDMVVAAGRSSGRSMVVKATAYNSEAGQTDNSPFITATGTRVRPGVVALSRDLLRTYPYGTRVTLQDLSGRSPWLNGRTFVVEDTMNVRMYQTIDLWMPSRAQALQWGSRQVRITAVR